MSKCCYCNRELTTGDNPSKLGLCNKCYDDLFRSNECALCSNKDKRISELEVKLNEKEKEIKELKQKVEKANSERHEEWITGKEWKWECDRLKRQLENAIIPKFKIGQIIYTFNKYNDCIYTLQVNSIHIERYNNSKFNNLVYSVKRLEDGFVGSYLEDDLFNTKEEAEEKLKEIMKSE